MSVDKELFQAAATVMAGIFQTAKTPADLAALTDGSKLREHFVRTYLELNQAALELQDLVAQKNGYETPTRDVDRPVRVNWG